MRYKIHIKVDHPNGETSHSVMAGNDKVGLAVLTDKALSRMAQTGVSTISRRTTLFGIKLRDTVETRFYLNGCRVDLDYYERSLGLDH